MVVETSKHPVAEEATMGLSVLMSTCLAMMLSAHPAQSLWPDVSFTSPLIRSLRGLELILSPPDS